MKFKYLFLLAALSGTFYACNGSKDGEQEIIEDELIDPKKALNTNFDGKIFSVPSPVQTALLLKSTNLPFDETLLNPVANVDNYKTEYLKSLNLGIYGANLGYASLFDQKSVSMNYLSTVEKLTSDLNLEGAFDKSFMKRYENNMGNEDSTMIIISDAFKKADFFLKNAKRKETSSLILTGGWIESLHLACAMNGKKQNKEIVQRIGEQKYTLETIIEILGEYNKLGNNDALIAQMEDLKVSFDKVKVNYEFVEPQTDEASKTTTLKHRIEFIADNALLAEITKKIEAIRTSIISK